MQFANVNERVKCLSSLIKHLKTASYQSLITCVAFLACRTPSDRFPLCVGSSDCNKRGFESEECEINKKTAQGFIPARVIDF